MNAFTLYTKSSSQIEMVRKKVGRHLLENILELSNTPLSFLGAIHVENTSTKERSLILERKQLKLKTILDFISFGFT